MEIPDSAPGAEDALDRLIWGRLPGLSGAKKAQLLTELGGDHCELLRGDKLRLPHRLLSKEASAQLRHWRRHPDSARSDLAADLDWLSQPQHRVLMPADDAYPAGLKQLAVPPLPLYLNGNAEALSLPLLGMVGSRKPSPAGRETAYRLAAELAHLGFGIVSGLAAGTDAAAHRGALDNKGTSIAVMATGPDRIYPAENRRLAERLCEKGALLTEYPVGTEVKRYQFPARNRILAALCRGVLVVEAGERSGALITAHQACELGLEVMAMPGAVQGGRHAGCHKLIREGAALVENSLQVLECLSCLPSADADQLARLGTAPGDICPPGLSEEERTVWEALDLTPTPADLLAQRLKWPIVRTSTVLSSLEIAGAVHREAGGYIRAA